MKSGDVVLIHLPPTWGGPSKLRPALVLAFLPGSYQDVLLCGISSQLKDLQPDWDDLLNPNDNDFSSSGVHHVSSIRLSYLYAADNREILGVIGQINPERLSRLLKRLSTLLTP